MFHEYREEISHLKQEDKYFHSIFQKHNDLDAQIIEMEKTLSDQFEIEKMKKEKLKLKDEIYGIILKYKQSA